MAGPEYFQSDNGTEFLNSCPTYLYQNRDIQKQSRTRYSQQKNRVAERANRTTIEENATDCASVPNRFGQKQLAERICWSGSITLGNSPILLIHLNITFEDIASTLIRIGTQSTKFCRFTAKTF